MWLTWPTRCSALATVVGKTSHPEPRRLSCTSRTGTTDLTSLRAKATLTTILYTSSTLANNLRKNTSSFSSISGELALTPFLGLYLLTPDLHAKSTTSALNKKRATCFSWPGTLAYLTKISTPTEEVLRMLKSLLGTITIRLKIGKRNGMSRHLVSTTSTTSLSVSTLTGPLKCLK